MSRPDPPEDSAPPTRGATTAVGGTPFAVDVSGDRRARITWVVLLAGPVIWVTHFMVVYLTAEAGCTGDGPGLDLFDPPVPRAVTLAATALAAVGCLGCAGWAWRRWQASPVVPHRAGAREIADTHDGDGRGPLAFAGFLLSVLSFAAVLFVGVPALVLGC